MRFVDSNVFVYALLSSRRPLSSRDADLKNRAKHILGRLDSEKMVTTVCHVSEVANIFEEVAGTEAAANVVRGILASENLSVAPVSPDDYFVAAEISSECGIGLNDALAVKVLRDRGVSEIYSFDRDFDKVPAVKRLQ